MRHPVFLLAGLLWFAPVSKAQEDSAEKTVEWMVNGMHCLPNDPSEARAWSRMRSDPQTYLPLLKARISLEAIEAAQDKSQVQSIESAVRVLIGLGVDEGREFLMERLSQLQRRREELDGQVRARAPKPGVTLAPGEKDAFGVLVLRRNRMWRVELSILRGLQEAADPRLRDHLLRRLDQEEDHGQFSWYVDYFAATAKEDPAVRARLKKLRETSNSELTKDALGRFFAWW